MATFRPKGKIQAQMYVKSWIGTLLPMHASAILIRLVARCMQSASKLCRNAYIYPPLLSASIAQLPLPGAR